MDSSSLEIMKRVLEAICFSTLLMSIMIPRKSFGYLENARIRRFHPRRVVLWSQALPTTTQGVQVLNSNLHFQIDEASLPSRMIQFIEGLKLAINQNQTEGLFQILREDARWINPFTRNKPELQQNLQIFSNFFNQQSIQFFGVSLDSSSSTSSSSYHVDYQLSFYYPLPWRPRVIVPAILTVTFDGDSTQAKVIEVIENWEVSVSDIAFKQLPPRFWDTFHTFPTPVPEYPPIKRLQKIKSIQIFELPQTIMYECTWKGLAKYPGPPLTALPDFCFLSSDLQGKKAYFTSLPVEVQSGKFVNVSDQSRMKLARWRCHVPTAVQDKVLSSRGLGQVIPLQGQSLLNNVWTIDENEDDDNEIEPLVSSQSGPTQDDLEEDGIFEKNEFEKLTSVINAENLDIMDSLKNGILRGNYELDTEFAKEYESKQQVYAVFKRIPKRIIASVDIPGEVTSEKISKYYKELIETIKQNPLLINQRHYELREGKESTNDEPDPDFSLLLPEIKSCWTPKGEIAMAYYETHFNFVRTKLFLELFPRA